MIMMMVNKLSRTFQAGGRGELTNTRTIIRHRSECLWNSSYTKLHFFSFLTKMTPVRSCRARCRHTHTHLHTHTHTYNTTAQITARIAMQSCHQAEKNTARINENSPFVVRKKARAMISGNRFKFKGTNLFMARAVRWILGWIRVKSTISKTKRRKCPATAETGRSSSPRSTAHAPILRTGGGVAERLKPLDYTFINVFHSFEKLHGS